MAAGESGNDASADELAAPQRTRVPSSDESSSPLTYAVFVGLLGGIIGWTVRVRRARAKAAPAP